MSLPDGAYKGFATVPTSPVTYGEVEATIRTNTLVGFRVATGNGAIEAAPPIKAPLREITEEEVRRYFYPENDTTGYQGYRLDRGYGLTLILRTEDPAKPNAPLVDAWFLRCPHTGDDTLTLLYTPDQVAAGLFDYDVAQWEAQQSYAPGSFPRLPQ